MSSNDAYWSLAEFANVHIPRVIGRASPAMFSCVNYCLRILDMPVKFPRTDYRVPPYASQFQPFVDQIAQHVGHHGDDRYAYLTVDQGLVKKDASQRAGGCHVDGLQGARIQPKVAADFSFVVADALPTVFYIQSWNVAGIDVETQNLFQELDRQAQEYNEWRPEPFEIVECDAYLVHRADSANKDVVRTFLRLAYSVREFDRLGNSVNPRFDYDWNYVSRDTPSGLVSYA